LFSVARMGVGPKDDGVVTHRHRRMTLTLASFCADASLAPRLDGAALFGRLDAMAHEERRRVRQWVGAPETTDQLFISPLKEPLD